MKKGIIFTSLLLFIFLSACSKEESPSTPITTVPETKDDINVSESNLESEKKDLQPKPTDEAIPIEKQKEYYIETIKPEFDFVVSEYNLIWESLWVKTFKDLGEGTLSFAEGYKKLEVAQIRYERLYEKIGGIPTDDLDKERKNKIGSICVEFEDAVAFRMEAIKKAKYMLDNENISESTVQDIESIVDDADGYFLQAINEQSDLEKDIGVENKNPE